MARSFLLPPMESEIWEIDPDLVIAPDPRTGCVAQWSIAAIFLVPGLLDGSVALTTLGAVVAACAAVGTFRALTRATTQFGARERSPEGASRPRIGWVRPATPAPARACRTSRQPHTRGRRRSRRRGCGRAMRKAR